MLRGCPVVVGYQRQSRHCDRRSACRYRIGEGGWLHVPIDEEEDWGIHLPGLILRGEATPKTEAMVDGMTKLGLKQTALLGISRNFPSARADWVASRLCSFAFWACV